MTSPSRRITIICGVVLALIPLFLFAFLSLHTRPMNDDYMNLGLSLRIGTWEAMLYWRGAWNGGYSNFILYGLLAPLGAAAPALFGLTILASALLAYSWMSNAVLARLGVRSNRRAMAVALAALAVAATINGIYSPHAFYSFTSAVVYTWPVVMFLLGIAVAAEATRRLRGSRQQLLAPIAAALYAFVNAGFSEMYLVFQLSAVFLIATYVFIFETGPKRRSYLILTIAAGLGTIASLALQLNAPGFAIRSSEEVNHNFLILPVKEQLTLIARALVWTLVYVGHRTSFAGFMLVACAALFVTLSMGNRPLEVSKLRRIPGIIAPIAFALIVQLLFLPILWTHQSDNPQVLGRFSYGFGLAVGINLCAAVISLALLWPRRMVADLFKRRDGLMKYCGFVLLTVCLLFATTQVLSVHYRASSFLFLTAVTLLFMLGGLLASLADEPEIRRLFMLSVSVTAGALLTLAVLITVEMVLVRFINGRSITSVVFAVMLAGTVNGVALGALIRHGFCLTAANAVWLRWIRLVCHLVAMTIAAGMAIGQGKRVSQVRTDAELWDSQHREIIRLRDEGDPAVYTMKFKRPVLGKYGHTPLEYMYAPLSLSHKLFYGLEYEDAFS